MRQALGLKSKGSVLDLAVFKLKDKIQGIEMRENPRRPFSPPLDAVTLEE